jgi:xylose isomerase-like TIM barrel protein
MKKSENNKNLVTRRRFLGLTATAAAFSMIPINISCANQSKSSKNTLPNSKFGGVQLGAITYSWRSMPGSSAEDILNYCIQDGISSVELMGNVAEEYAGLPMAPPRPAHDVVLSDSEKEAYEKAVLEAKEAQLLWRISAPMTKFEELRLMYNEAGVDIHIAKFSPANWSDEEIDYSFMAAKALGAKGVCNEIGEKSAKRLGAFAEKHGMYAIFHQHLQPGEPGWTFEKFLDYSPANMLNLDVGHYFGATGLHPNDLIERLHDRIVSIHVKDKTGPKSDPANTNMPFGLGETPIADILLLIKKNNWPIYVDIELEYPVPEDSDAVAEVKKCVDYCKEILT